MGGPIPGGSAVRRDVAVFVAVVALGIGALTSLVACLPALAARVIAFRRVGAVLAHVVRAATAEALSHGRLAGVGRDLIGARGRQLTKVRVVVSPQCLRPLGAAGGVDPFVSVDAFYKVALARAAV